MYIIDIVTRPMEKRSAGRNNTHRRRCEEGYSEGLSACQSVNGDDATIIATVQGCARDTGEVYYSRVSVGWL